MSESKRIPLEPGMKIRLCRTPDGFYGDHWTITSVTPGGEGGSSICYEASHDGKHGRLKEFYPGDISLSGRDWQFLFERTEDHQLRPLGQSMSVRFQQMCQDFLGAYHMLEKAKEDSPNSHLLNNYIPAYEILYGFCDDGTAASVYIWTPDDKQGQNFQEYLSEVRAHPEQLPEHKLYNILNTLITLCNCIRVLHEADLLHLDIKPSNFLVLYDGSFNINPFSISLFDVNSLYSIYSPFPKITGTPGFRAPEVLEGSATSSADIYSIGAMLYHAVVIGSGPELYEDSLYPSLNRLVAGSALLQASESHSNIYLRDCLTTILRKCLVRNPRKRYESTEEIIADLEKGRAYLLPEVFSDDLGLTQRLAILDSEPQDDCSPTAVIQELLYQHPLYEKSGRTEPNINVLALGAGTYGQFFLDQALQSGQMVGKRLRLTALSDCPDRDRELYLSSRPALSGFVNVDGSMAHKPADSYGDLTFRGIPGEGAFRKDAPEETRKMLKSILSGASGDDRFHYVFIALGDDALNTQVAAQCAGLMGQNSSIHYVLRSREAPQDPPAHPVMINRSLTAQAIDPDLDRLGFNIHICWESSRNLNITEVRKTYLKPYFRTSSLACALAIRSKLASVGIFEKDLNEAARRFQEQIVEKRRGMGAGQQKFQQLVALEHRRWVLEKVTDGWQDIPVVDGRHDYASLIRRSLTNDKSERRHPCLVFSTVEAPLCNFTPDQWNEPGPQDEALDELDRMSVEFHRACLAEAKRFLEAQPLRKLELQAIRSCLNSAPESVLQEFERYQLCLKNILDGNRNYTEQYSDYASSFERSLAPLDRTVQDAVKVRMELIRGAIFPVVQSNLFVDYKAKDEVLIEKIPFILTYQVEPRLAAVFEDGRLDNGKNSRVFTSVASATVINPSHVSYLYYFDGNSRTPLLVRKLESVLNYFSRRSMRCTVSLCVAFAPEIPLAAREEAKRRLSLLEQDGRLTGLKFLNPQTPDKAAAQFTAELQSAGAELFDCSASLFASPRQNQHFLSAITGEMPTFEFDWLEKKFLEPRNCDYLTYIDDKSFVRIDDMFALMRATDKNHYFPEFADVYMDLWKVYSGSAYMTGYYAFYNGANNWNQMCDLLEAYTKANDVVCRFSFPVQEQLEDRVIPYYLPDYLFDTLQPILRQLKQTGVVLDKSSLVSCNSDFCLLTVHTEHDIQEPLDDLISVLYDRSESASFSVYASTGFAKDADGVQTIQKVTVRGDRLAVKDMVVENRFVLKVLSALSELHLINQFRSVEVPETRKTLVSFRFTSPRMKKLLTTAGAFLEVYTYYDVKKQGYFDDIACSFEFLWETGDITNELDCVLTRGFRSIIVECKSRRNLSQDYYYKLSAIADQFGLGAKKVLIANTYNISNAGVVAENDLNRSRGRQIDVITISDPKEIRNIGMTLRRILEGTYRQEL